MIEYEPHLRIFILILLFVCWHRLFSGRKEAKEDKPEKNWGMWPAHGELIVAKKKWDSITRCVIQGRCSKFLPILQ